MSNVGKSNSKRRLRAEIVIAIAATIVSVCAMIATVYQTYIIRQQQHAAVWPRLQLSHGYRITEDTAFYSLKLQNNGVGPAIIRNVSISYRDSSFTNVARLAETIARQNNLPDSIVYSDYRDLEPEMVVPQQESWELLSMYQSDYAVAWVRELIANENIQLKVQYESLYGETWEVKYPGSNHRKID